jgi:hypothetical protein
MKNGMDTVASVAVALIFATAGVIPCVIVFLRPRWFRKVLAAGVALAALFSIGMGLTENTADMDDEEAALLYVIVGGLLLFAWCLGALWGHLFDRWRERLRAVRSGEDPDRAARRRPAS